MLCLRRRVHISTSVMLLALATLASCRPPRVLTIQQDAGIEGNGVELQPGPYNKPVEMTQRLEGAPEGTLSPPGVYFSKIFNANFSYRIYVPAQYKPGMAASFMVFQDGNKVYVDQMNAPMVLDNLIHSGEMPVTIALFLDAGKAVGPNAADSDSAQRSLQYDTPNEKYGQFLVKEIIPDIVKKDYRLVADPSGWAIAGHGSGGFAAFNVAWSWSDYFRKVLTQNASFVNIKAGQGDAANNVRNEIIKPLRVYLSSGTGDLNNQFGNWLDANNAMAASLAAREYNFRMRSGTGAHSPPTQAVADFPDALRWLWRGYFSGRLDGK